MNSLEENLRKMEIISEAEPIDFFRTGNGGLWLLAIADGIRSLQRLALEFEDAGFGMEYPGSNQWQ